MTPVRWPRTLVSSTTSSPPPRRPPPLRLNELCTAAEAWASTTDSIAAIRGTVNQFDAIARCMQLTATDNRAEVEATTRRLEVRTGPLLGLAEHDGDQGNQRMGGKSATTELANHTELTHRKRSDSCQMAESPDIVDDIIAESTDECHRVPSGL